MDQVNELTPAQLQDFRTGYLELVQSLQNEITDLGNYNFEEAEQFWQTTITTIQAIYNVIRAHPSWPTLLDLLQNMEVPVHSLSPEANQIAQLYEEQFAEQFWYVSLCYHMLGYAILAMRPYLDITPDPKVPTSAFVIHRIVHSVIANQRTEYLLYYLGNAFQISDQVSRLREQELEDRHQNERERQQHLAMVNQRENVLEDEDFREPEGLLRCIWTWMKFIGQYIRNWVRDKTEEMVTLWEYVDLRKEEGCTWEECPDWPLLKNPDTEAIE